MTKRVCIVRFFPYPQESHVRRDATTLLEAGYEVDVIAARAVGQASSEVVDGVNVYRLPVSPERGSTLMYLSRYVLFTFLSFFLLGWLQIRRRYHAVEIDTMPDFLVFAAFVPKLAGANVVLYLFEAMPVLFMARKNLPEDSRIIKVLKLFERWAVQFADHVITVNEVHRALVTDRCPAEGKVSVILNVPNEELLPASRLEGSEVVGAGVEGEGADPEGSGALGSEADNAGRDGFLLVHHGTLARRYGVQTAIDALAVLQHKIEGVRLRVIGEGDYLEELKDRVRMHRLEVKVEFIGWVPFEKLVELVIEADIGLVPFIQDVYTELMLPNKLFEYIGLGLPVVAARTRAVRETYDETCVAFFNPDDSNDCARAILELHGDPSGREEMVEKARQVFEASHRWGIMKKHYTDIYSNII